MNEFRRPRPERNSDLQRSDPELTQAIAVEWRAGISQIYAIPVATATLKPVSRPD